MNKNPLIILKISFFVLFFAAFISGCREKPLTPVLAVDGVEFTLDGKPFDMWVIRVGSATINEDYTNHLIDQLDEYIAYGVNTLAVFYMGTSGGYACPFTSDDGLHLDPGHQQRMTRIIEEAALRDMVVVTGIFYQRVEPRFRDSEGVRNAVRTVTRDSFDYLSLTLLYSLFTALSPHLRMTAFKPSSDSGNLPLSSVSMIHL